MIYHYKLDSLDYISVTDWCNEPKSYRIR